MNRGAREGGWSKTKKGRCFVKAVGIHHTVAFAAWELFVGRHREGNPGF